MSKQSIKRALISVSNKDGILELARFLVSNKVEIISTGGTAKLLKDNKIETKDISEFTGFPEIMDGRVKTLHPKVHGALLGILDNSNHQAQATQNDISSIDLLIVNLYPFTATVNSGHGHDEIVENIDIGGPAMIRSAAKNYQYKTIIMDPKDYESLVGEMQNNTNSTNLEYRTKQAAKAFSIIANYDQAIADYFSKYLKQDFAPNLSFPSTLKQALRYGENSHQKAALYSYDFSKSGIVNAKQLQGKELSYNNFNDADAAFNIVMEFDLPAAVIVKHANPCGVAIGTNIGEAYSKALEADSKSAFGGIVALNSEVDFDLANEISKMFYEVVIAPAFSSDALKILSSKKNLRLLVVNLENNKNIQIKSISGGLLVQSLDDKILTSFDLKQVGNIKPTEKQIKELVFAMSVCKHVKSNAIVVVNDFQTVGIGAGQMSRVDSSDIACKKASNFSNKDGKLCNKAKGSVLASDAFFPFADGVELAASYGISAIIAPSGSIRDEEVIATANKHEIVLMFVETRHFKH